MVATKTKVNKHLTEVRAKKGRDLSPNWEGCETWTGVQFYRFFVGAMAWYRLESSAKELKPKVIDWMGRNGYTRDQIKAFKATKDNRCNSTMGAIAANLIRGMQPVRIDFNQGRSAADWLGAEIAAVIEQGKNDAQEEAAVVEVKSAVPVMNIQDRLREAAKLMTAEIEDALDSFSQDPEAFDLKAFKMLNLLKGKGVKAAHARIIKSFYTRNYDELVEAAGTKDEQLKEGYSHLTKAQLKKITAFYNEILTACDMLAQEAKINKKPRAKKAVPAEKIVGKMKYAKTHEPLKLVSVNPVDIVGAKELWIYNVKTRKIGKYVAAEFSELSVKGTSITGFSESQSVQKTLRKPEDQLKEFKAAGKVALRKFLEDIKAVDIKLNGRINEDTVLLKVLA
jgi:CII-binding regulator of phage lambda lysogenization HflD